MLSLAHASAALTLPADAFRTIAHGRVHVEPNFIPPSLVKSMRQDALGLLSEGLFAPDGLTNTAVAKSRQGFSVGDRQTYRNDAWDAKVGDVAARLEFQARMTALRLELAAELGRPTLAPEGFRKHEITYNMYEPGAKLGRHLDEHHEETKGSKGWLMPTRRSVTWLVYLNDGWTEEEGGALRCFPRAPAAPSDVPVGAHQGNLQVGWLDGTRPVFLDSGADPDRCALYTVDASSRADVGGAAGAVDAGVVGGGATTTAVATVATAAVATVATATAATVATATAARERRVVLSPRGGFAVPPRPVDFGRFLAAADRPRFEQISTARLDPRFAAPEQLAQAQAQNPAGIGVDASAAAPYFEDVTPRAGTLVVFDSVSLPHQVQPITGQRRRVAATGWFHEEQSIPLA